MSGKQEHRRRDNLRFMYIADYNEWLRQEPPMILFWRWRRWKKSRPIWDPKAQL